MKQFLVLLTLGCSFSAVAQVWKTLPKNVRIMGYRNVITSKVTSNFDQFRSESPLGAQFKIDANTANTALGGGLESSLPPEVYKNLVVGEYAVDASAQFNVHGTGFGYGITNKVMFYTEIAYYQAQVNTKIKRLKGNTYEKTKRLCEDNSQGVYDTTICQNLGMLIDANESTVQSFVTNSLGYKPIGNWQGAGYGDMETGLMINVLDKGYTGLLFYPGVIVPTGRTDDPDILQDVGFGDGQYDLFSELGTGYVVNDRISFGTTLRYTYQAPGDRELRVPSYRDMTLSSEKDSFDFKYGDRINWMINGTYAMNDWLSFTPVYRYMRQQASTYSSSNSDANKFLSYNTDKYEHQMQFTTSVSSIQPFLKKKFILPATINMNLVQTMGGKNVPKVGRFELELRMLF